MPFQKGSSSAESCNDRRKFRQNNKKTPDDSHPGFTCFSAHREHQAFCLNLTTLFFSHPDCTVGFGIAPNQPLCFLLAYSPPFSAHTGRGLYRR
jgi:hypothetical protein